MKKFYPMYKKDGGPFKRNSSTKTKHQFRIDLPWTCIALVLITIFQLPVALKASIDLTCFIKALANNESKHSWCHYK